MWRFLLGGAVGYMLGYVLGSRAGRERYEQMARGCRQLKDHPAVQGAAGVVSAKIVEVRGGKAQRDQ